jgi:membrane protein required for colicin V production
MNAVDITILAVLGGLLLKGVWLGLIHELCALAGLVGGTLLAIRYRIPLGEVLGRSIKLPPELLVVIASSLLFLATLATCVFIGLILSRFVKLLFLGGFNRVLGALFGLVQGVILLTLVLYGLSLTAWFKEPRQSSRLAPPFVGLAEELLSQRAHWP